MRSSYQQYVGQTEIEKPGEQGHWLGESFSVQAFGNAGLGQANVIIKKNTFQSRICHCHICRACKKGSWIW